MRKIDSTQADMQYNILAFLQLYATLVIWFPFIAIFFVLAWYCFGQFLAGTPEPEWWSQFEAVIGVTW